MSSPNPRIEALRNSGTLGARKRSNSLEHLRGILRDCEKFLPGTPERLNSLENMHNLLAAESKRMRSVADGSPASGEAIERFFEPDGSSSLGLGGAYSEFHMEPHDVTFMDYEADHVKPEHGEDSMLPQPPQGLAAHAPAPPVHHNPHVHHPHHPIGLPPRPHPVPAEPPEAANQQPERRLSHKEVEQRRREKAKQYFDELRSLLPSAQDSKFDKNSILQNSIQLIKSLRAELSAASLVRGGVDSSPLSLEYRFAFSVSRQCLAFAGLDGRIWEANHAFCMLLGYGQEETTALTILSVTAREDSELSLKQGRRLLSRESGPSCSYNVRLVKKDGGYLQCNVELNLLERENMPYCFLFSAQPIG